MKTKWTRRSLLAAGVALSLTQSAWAGILCRLRRRRRRACPVATADPVKWTSLFDGKALGKWKTTNYGGEGEVRVADHRVHLDAGNPLTGIHYSGDVPKTNYEVELQARRTAGIDFFCCLTFPVAKSHCSLVVAGWAGSVVGLSSINEQDASENATTRHMKFNDKQWYKIRLRVEEERIQAWIDDKRVVNQDIRGKKISLRVEVEPSKPLGICTFQTRAELKDIRMRKL